MKAFPKINLHIHSTYSDGTNSIREIIDKSVKLGLDYICITDHFTNSWKADIIPSLDTKEKIEDYLYEISEIQQELTNNRQKLTLLKGIEVDITSSYDYITKMVSPKDFDIILFEYLQNNEGIGFIKNILLSWEKGLNLQNDDCLFGLAHFDPSYFEYSSLEILVNFLKEYNIFFEFNSTYPQFYSQRYKRFFTELRANQILVSIGCDSHSSSNLDNFEEPLEMIQFYGLELNFGRFIELLKLIKI